MVTGTTVQGSVSKYSGSLVAGIVVSFNHTRLRISPEVISFIRAEIMARSPVLMGTCRKPLALSSLGEALYSQHHVTPQVVSYVVPLLIEEGLCTVSQRKPFIVSLNGAGAGI